MGTLPWRAEVGEGIEGYNFGMGLGSGGGGGRKGKERNYLHTGASRNFLWVAFRKDAFPFLEKMTVYGRHQGHLWCKSTERIKGRRREPQVGVLEKCKGGDQKVKTCLQYDPLCVGSFQGSVICSTGAQHRDERKVTVRKVRIILVLVEFTRVTKILERTQIWIIWLSRI